MGSILTKNTILQISHELRSQNDSVVFTHGAFDLFHVGHAYFLKESKQKGDFLVVGVESDARIGKYKGVTRPVIPLQERLRILASNSAVDFVFAIDDELLNSTYYVELYARMKPQIVTYGPHFGAKDNITAEQKFLRDTHFEEVTPQNGRSTTSIIDKILGSN